MELIYGIGVGIIISVCVGIAERMRRPNPECIYRDGYIAALDSIAGRFIHIAVEGKSKRLAARVYDDFLAPEYDAKSANCKYNIPWETNNPWRK